MRCVSQKRKRTSVQHPLRFLLAPILSLVILALLFLGAPNSSAARSETVRQAGQDLFSVSFPTEKDGWACGRWGTILHTQDGGLTWAPQKSGTDYSLTSIFFADAQNGWAVGEQGIILNTRNGGKAWEQQKSPLTSYLMGVHFINGQKGWVVGERTTILYTEDAGKSWKLQFKDEDYILKSISFCDDKNGWAVGEFGFIYHTDNGGATWKKQAGDYGFSDETGEMIGGNMLFSIVAVNPRTALAVGIDGYVIKTRNSGETWEPQTSKGIPKTHLYGVTQKLGTVVIGGNSILLASKDEGISFQNVKATPEITYGWIYGISPRGNAGFVAVGKAGWIYVSDNKGTEWKRATNR